MVPNHSSVSLGEGGGCGPYSQYVSLGEDRTQSLITVMFHLVKAKDAICYPEVMHTLLELKSDTQSGRGIGGQADRK